MKSQHRKLDKLLAFHSHNYYICIICYIIPTFRTVINLPTTFRAKLCCISNTSSTGTANQVPFFIFLRILFCIKSATTTKSLCLRYSGMATWTFFCSISLVSELYFLCHTTKSGSNTLAHPKSHSKSHSCTHYWSNI